MRPAIFIALSACLVGGAAVTVGAEELEGTLKKIKESGTITIGHRDSSVPLSYLDDKLQPVGFSIDLCRHVVEAVKAKLTMPNLNVAYNPVTSATRIPLVANGTVDVECGSNCQYDGPTEAGRILLYVLCPAVQMDRPRQQRHQRSRRSARQVRCGYRRHQHGDLRQQAQQ